MFKPFKPIQIIVFFLKNALSNYMQIRVRSHSYYCLSGGSIFGDIAI